MSEQEQNLNACDCCEGLKKLTPLPVENLPGLSALVYRVGTHGSFKATMLAAIAEQPRLRELTTRDNDDPSIALIDGWATALDALSFYQERIANEGFLRTATERRSILELARSIGYELRGGVAASTCLAFTVEAPRRTTPETDLAIRAQLPDPVVIDVGVKAQSVPGQDELPQIFETVEKIEARAAWQDLRAKTTTLVSPQPGDTQLYLKGAATNLKTGDALLLVGDERKSDLSSESWQFRRVKDVSLQPPLNFAEPDTAYTIVTLDRQLDNNTPLNQPEVYALRLRAALFGHNAPDWRSLPQSVKAGYLGLDQARTDLHDDLKNYSEWPGFTIAGISDPPPVTAVGIGLYGEYFTDINFSNRVKTEVNATINFPADWSPLPGQDNFSVRWTGWVQPKVTGMHTFFVNSDDGSRLWVNNILVVDNWGVHGAAEVSGNINLEAGAKYDIRLDYFDNGGAAVVELRWSAPGVAKEIIPTARLYPRAVHSVHLDAAYPQIIAGGWVVLATPLAEEVYSVAEARESARANFAISAKTTRLALAGENLTESFNERLRETAVFAHSEKLELAERPISVFVGQDDADPTKFVDSVMLSKPVEGLKAGRLVSITGIEVVDGKPTGKPVGEVRILATTITLDDITSLIFTEKLSHHYQRDSVIINANVARATHGETKNETLGAGDGSRPFQKFALKQKPLTFVSAPTATGSKTTLEVRVNDVLWEEAPSFYRQPPDKRLYITRLADDGQVTVQFGNGANGARLPTGPENVKATYRVGVGLPGMVKAGQISLLMSRPLGLKEVINPMAPSGAQDPERLDQARQNAPLTVLTLDRIVSLRDYEDFARAFAGVGKAQAAMLTRGELRLIHMTVAAQNGGAIEPGSATAINLRDAIDAARHPKHQVRIDSYAKRTFNFSARLLIDPTYIAEQVEAKVREALLADFSFDRREFGQAVTESEIVAIAQKVKGVVAVLEFDLPGADAQGRLLAKPGRFDETQIDPNGTLTKPAELLLINSDDIDLKVEKA